MPAHYADLRATVARYYTSKLNTHGACARGVDWNSDESQRLRFAQLLKLCEGRPVESILDYGCGYGALAGCLPPFLAGVEYRGYDASPEMVAAARRLHADRPGCTFLDDEALLTPADCTLASGVFNVKLDTPDDEWRDYLLRTLDTLRELSTAGFTFNVLTSYSDADRMRSDLYYADPCDLFDHCKRRFSRNVALLHDYGLYEFTIHVRLES